jgi:transposase
VTRDATAQRLQTIPGIGPSGALLLHAEIGPIGRFGSARELAACAGLVPSTRSSGGKTAHGGVGRGNSWLEWLLIEALQTLKLAPGPVGEHYRKLLRAHASAAQGEEGEHACSWSHHRSSPPAVRTAAGKVLPLGR